MKLNRTYLFIIISSIALLIVLIIQVNWIVQTAKVKEELFNERANLVLLKTADALSADKETYRNIAAANMILSKTVIANNAGNKYYINPSAQLSENDTHKIDSLFNHYMKLYNIHIEYSFLIKPNIFAVNTLTNLKIPSNQNSSFQTCIGDASDKNSMELQLVFPGKKQFIIAEMGIPFITSVILILVVMIMSWRTIISLWKEKKISEHTNDFLNNMTHEFKTPLTNIALAGKLMIKDSNISQEEKIKHYSGIILNENEKLRLQVEQVLSMTALERGEIPLHKTEIDFHQLINDSLKCISIQIENKQGDVKLNFEAENFIISGDKTHLTNALCNLIDNAVKYSKDTPEITIQTFNADNLVIKISDNGDGIPKEYQENVFNKFFRVPTGDVHDVKGFGLGLTYVKKIFELHAGTIELESEKGNGTTFIITLPNV